MSYIDQNDKPVWLALNETTGLIEPVYVDPITNELPIYVTIESENTPTAINTAKIDANDKATEIAFNETTGLIEALRCGSHGELLIKM